MITQRSAGSQAIARSRLAGSLDPPRPGTYISAQAATPLIAQAMEEAA
jgi:hypothetical protein